MADIQLDDLANGGDRLHVVIVQTVAGVHGESKTRCMTSRVLYPLQLTPLTLAADSA